MVLEVIWTLLICLGASVYGCEQTIYEDYHSEEACQADLSLISYEGGNYSVSCQEDLNRYDIIIPSGIIVPFVN